MARMKTGRDQVIPICVNSSELAMIDSLVGEMRTEYERYTGMVISRGEAIRRWIYKHPKAQAAALKANEPKCEGDECKVI